MSICIALYHSTAKSDLPFNWHFLRRCIKLDRAAGENEEEDKEKKFGRH